MVSESCLYSLATLEVVCGPGSASFALIECEHSGVWRWAIISASGSVLDDGHEPTQLRAKELAELALHFVAA